MTGGQIRVLAQAWHRNGVGGDPFVVSIVEWPLGGEEARAAGSPSRLFLAVSFLKDDDGEQIDERRTAVVNIGQVAEGDARSAWRGADYVGPAVASNWAQLQAVLASLEGDGCDG